MFCHHCTILAFVVVVVLPGIVFTLSCSCQVPYVTNDIFYARNMLLCTSYLYSYYLSCASGISVMSFLFSFSHHCSFVLTFADLVDVCCISTCLLLRQMKSVTQSLQMAFSRNSLRVSRKQRMRILCIGLWSAVVEDGQKDTTFLKLWRVGKGPMQPVLRF